MFSLLHLLLTHMHIASLVSYEEEEWLRQSRLFFKILCPWVITSSNDVLNLSRIPNSIDAQKRRLCLQLWGLGSTLPFMTAYNEPLVVSPDQWGRGRQDVALGPWLFRASLVQTGHHS